MAYCKQCGFPNELNGSNNDPQRQLVEVEDEILQLEAQLSKRLERHRALKQQVNTQCSPLIQLPLDILSEISMAAFPEGDTDSWNRTTPLLLGSICRAWRDVAWSIPRLWRTIRMDVLGRYSMSKASLLEEWLLRSRQFPLSIHLKLTHPRKYKGPRNHKISHDVSVMWKIMDLIGRCSERWQHVHLDIPVFFSEDKCSVPHGLSQLRSLSLLSPAAYSSEGLYIFQHAPLLSDVSCRAGEATFLPVHPLRCLTLEYARIGDCLSLLKRHPNLVQCTFKSLSYMNPIEFTSVEALSLEVLGINFTDSDPRVISQLLDHLSTPALRDLTIHIVISDMPPFPHTSLIRLILRSSCPLVRLNLFGLRISDAQLIECLAVLRSLMGLKLEDMAIGAHTIHKLTTTPDQNEVPLLPNLLSLSLVLDGDVLFDFADLAKMVRSRRWGMAGAQAVGGDSKLLAVARMEVISVRVITYGEGCRGLPTVAVLAHFQELEDEGMKVHLEISDH